MLKKILILLAAFSVFGCSGGQRYYEVVQKGYKNSKDYEAYKEKKVDDISYYKNKKKGKRLFFFVKEEDEKTMLYLSLKYKGRNWMYMSKIEFRDKEIDESYILDFYEHKLYRSIWKDRTTLGLKVEEYIAFPLVEEEIENIIYYLQKENIELVYHSDYDERKAYRDLKEKDREYMLEVYEFYENIKNTKLEKEELRKAEAEKVVDENKEKFEIDNKKSI